MEEISRFWGHLLTTPSPCLGPQKLALQLQVSVGSSVGRRRWGLRQTVCPQAGEQAFLSLVGAPCCLALARSRLLAGPQLVEVPSDAHPPSTCPGCLHNRIPPRGKCQPSSLPAAHDAPGGSAGSPMTEAPGKRRSRRHSPTKPSVGSAWQGRG